MDSVAERDAMRLKVLGAVRDATAGGRAHMINVEDWATAQGLDVQAVVEAATWSADRGYLDKPAWGPMFRITPPGEDFLDERERERLRNPASRNEERVLFLEAAYDATSGGRRGERARIQSMPDLTGLDPQAAEDAYEYLADAGLIEAVALGGVFEVTHLGVRQVEEWRAAEAAEAPEPTDDEAHLEDAQNPSSAPADRGVVLIVLDAVETGQLEALLTDVRRLLDDDEVCPPSPAADDLEHDLNDATDLLREQDVPAGEASWAARALRASLRAAAQGVAGNRADTVVLKLWDWAVRISGIS